MSTLEWVGKDKVINHHQEVPYRVLERRYSFDTDGQHDADNGNENVIIRGDNLEALKAPLPRYERRVKRGVMRRGASSSITLVFADGAEPLPGAVGMKQFVEIIAAL